MSTVTAEVPVVRVVVSLSGLWLDAGPLHPLRCLDCGWRGRRRFARGLAGLRDPRGCPKCGHDAVTADLRHKGSW